MVLAEITYDGYREALIVDLGEEYFFISTLPFQPSVADSIIFKRVPRDFSCRDLKGYYEGIRGALGRRSSIVFLTAASLDDYIYRVEDGGRIVVVATVGLEPPVCPGYRGGYGVGTINVAVILDYGLSYNAMLDLLRVVAEAKSLACSELLLRCSLRSPGTVTDAIAIGRRLSQDGGMIFAGMATSVGSIVSEAIYRELVGRGLRKLGLEGFLVNTIGLTLEDLVELTVEAYRKSPVPGVSVEEVRSRARATLLRLLEDPNVTSMLVAGRELDLHALAGSIPGLKAGASWDDESVVVDKLLALTLSIYVAGLRGLMAMYWVEELGGVGLTDSMKHRFESRLTLALVASTLAKVYGELLGERG